ncbi:hypothetical protein CEP54_012661 [Fusarium duplospermum]|uniref:Zn(2)-C6 fungal-type domain-containing protein n=1 Tax=Fusarium duplospermum TaxID=1325734 RepID=A0A428P7F7_9HYPO|nr:hypothetical protein CEP54_012661 [Fusarium duplospermum]
MATPGTGTNHSLSSLSTPQTPEGFGLRRKRKQVSRACDSCRIQRIKCDDTVPCLNCRTRGKQCSNTGTNKPSSLPQAINEIEKLKAKVKELENQLRQERSARFSSSESQREEAPPPFTTPTSQSTEIEIEPAAKTKYWDGIHIRPARSPHGAWFGPSSLYYFTHRLGTFLNAQADNMLVHLASNLELLGQPNPPDDSSRLLAPLAEINNSAVYLTSIQEGYFISLFWQSYHTSLYSVLDEASFNSHYQSLYVNVPPGNSRRPSALVDIVIAMCMQYGTSKLPRGEQGSLAQDNDATMAGRWYYRRAQALLACEVQSPSISTLQCQLLCAAYVCSGSFHNMADSISGLAVRTAYTLGLHIDPPPDIPEPERQMRRRLWWSVFELDTLVGMKLGRPFLLQDCHVMPELPSDSLDAAIMSGSTFAPVANDTTWLSFNLQRIKLYRVARTIHNATYGHDLGLDNGKTVYEYPDRLEDLANAIYPLTKHMEDWIKQVPRALKTARKEQGNPFAIDGSLLDIEQYAPNWLQRQRLLLELEYCHIYANLNRPFISFATRQVPGCRSYKMAGRSASHAIELCNITHQILSGTPLLHGCHRVFQWQWNGAMTLVGFVVAYPQHALTPAARAAIKLAVSSLETFGAGFEAAAKAAVIVRTLSSNLDSVMEGLAVSQSSEVNMGNSLTNGNASTGVVPSSHVMNGGSDINHNATDVDLFDMALGVDFWAGMDVLWPGVCLNVGEASLLNAQTG